MWKRHGTVVIAHGGAAFAHIEPPRVVAARETILAVDGPYRLTQGMIWDALALFEASAGRTFLPSERRAMTRLAEERFRQNPKATSDALTRAGFHLPRPQQLCGTERAQARQLVFHALYTVLGADDNGKPQQRVIG